MNEHGEYMDAHLADAVIQPRGCVVRLYDDGPAVHANSAHIAIGVTGVLITSSGDLRVLCDQVPDSAVVSLWASVDETLADRGVFCGGSGGNVMTTYRFRKEGYGRIDLNDPAEYALIAGATSNVWLGWLSIRRDQRGTGAPGPLERIAALEQRVHDLEAQEPGSFARVGSHHHGLTFGQIDVAHHGLTFGQVDEAHDDV